MYLSGHSSAVSTVGFSSVSLKVADVASVADEERRSEIFEFQFPLEARPF